MRLHPYILAPLLLAVAASAIDSAPTPPTAAVLGKPPAVRFNRDAAAAATPPLPQPPRPDNLPQQVPNDGLVTFVLDRITTFTDRMAKLDTHMSRLETDVRRAHVRADEAEKLRDAVVITTKKLTKAQRHQGAGMTSLIEKRLVVLRDLFQDTMTRTRDEMAQLRTEVDSIPRLSPMDRFVLHIATLLVWMGIAAATVTLAVIVYQTPIIGIPSLAFAALVTTYVMQ